MTRGRPGHGSIKNGKMNLNANLPRHIVEYLHEEAGRRHWTLRYYLEWLIEQWIERNVPMSACQPNERLAVDMPLQQEIQEESREE